MFAGVVTAWMRRRLRAERISLSGKHRPRWAGRSAGGGSQVVA
jgi:hypothetical protein